MSDVVVLDHVSLWRRTQEELHYDLKRLVFSILQNRYRKPSKRLVLDDVSLRISSGEKLGIIGANGSGKSTILKTICGILQPTRGRVRIEGSIAPLIELGAGFDGDLSVVDNIVYYAILLGIPKRVARDRVETILDFSELHDHRNEPVKALSSGMTARLGFAIATEFRPEILVLDEVLSVGDERFRHKCQARINRFWDQQCTIVVVSHDLEFVAKNCTRVVWMDAGKVVYDGDPVDGMLRYRASVEAAIDAELREARRKMILVRGSREGAHGDRIYAVVHGVKRWVTDPQWLIDRGFDRPEHALLLDDAALNAIPEGRAIVYGDAVDDALVEELSAAPGRSA